MRLVALVIAVCTWWFLPVFSGYPKELWAADAVFAKVWCGLFLAFCVWNFLNGWKAAQFFDVPDTKRLGRTVFLTGAGLIGFFVLQIVLLAILGGGYSVEHFIKHRIITYPANALFWFALGWLGSGTLTALQREEA